MDLHPIFVHFPIAFLVVYSAMEILSFRIFTRQAWWFYVKAVLLIVGFVGGWLSLVTGEVAAEAYQGTATMNIIRLHESFAKASMIVYGILMLSYVIRWIDRDGFTQKLPSSLRTAFTRIHSVERKIFFTPVLILLSILGFVLLSIVGALGGAIVYGPEVDPVVSVVYHFFFAE